jgi:hypothetical protein
LENRLGREPEPSELEEWLTEHETAEASNFELTGNDLERAQVVRGMFEEAGIPNPTNE